MRPSYSHLLPLWALGSALLLPSCGDSQRPLGKQSLPVATHPAAGNPHPLANSTAYVFDIPALVDLTANQIKAKLGKPLSDAQESENDQMKTLTYQRQGYKLLINYEARSRRILDFYLYSPNSTKEYQYLLAAANVTQHDKRYKVEPLDSGDGLYTELYVVPGIERTLDRFGNWVPVEQAQ